ncbi:MAG: stage II sporulation protein D [Tenericutes bacterium]|nr:stage II sporulation protein D [Mycoplasmatota bacterium]
MKKIIIFTAFLIIIPFIIVTILLKEPKEIELKYASNTVVRIKREKKNIIETIPLEEYIVGVLAGEMPISFEIEALKAQAVASRSYALNKIANNKDKEYDVVDTIMNQVYLDNDYLKSVWKNTYVTKINKLKTAVNETFGEYLDYNGSIVNAMFFSTSNGYTEDSKNVFGFEADYLKSVNSPWDEETSTAFNSSKEISLQEFYEKLNLPYQEKLTVEITKRSPTNRILNLKINNQDFASRELYNKLSLKSTDFVIIQNGSNIIIKTKGYGHGVGMSQYGALGMAKQGKTYEEILSHYYKDTKIKKISF